jgi:hypothetical protein
VSWWPKEADPQHDEHGEAQPQSGVSGIKRQTWIHGRRSFAYIDGGDQCAIPCGDGDAGMVKNHEQCVGLE